jgi:hypothetical protein
MKVKNIKMKDTKMGKTVRQKNKTVRKKKIGERTKTMGIRTRLLQNVREIVMKM